MRDIGRIKERYDFSLDSRQLGLVLFAGLVAAVLLFVLGMSVGRQWERKLAAVQNPHPVSAEAPEAGVAPAVSPEVVTPAPPVKPAQGQKPADASPPEKSGEGGGTEEKQGGDSAAIKPEDLTFPKVLTASKAQPAPSLKKAKPAPAGPAKSASSEAAFTVQVAAVRDRKSADGLAAKLKKKGYPAGVYEAKGPNGSIYRVHVGSFDTRGEALKTADRINAAEKTKAYVTSYR